MTLNNLRAELEKQKSVKVAEQTKKFFKTGHGDYAQHDIFLGIKIPDLRKIIRNYTTLPATELSTLLNSFYHEERLASLLILIENYRQAPKIAEKNNIYRFYVQHIPHINNWDLVDLSAPQLVGAHLLNKPKSVLPQWAKAKNLWKRRIAIVSTLHFIRHDHFQTTLDISTQLLNDTHDLIHKATGWMLREVGKRDIVVLEKFLKKHYKIMPRTMLRYAIERLPNKRRQAYLGGTI